MNAESFATFLAQPAKLYQLSYQEIKNLVAEYPFAPHLRLLLYIKSRIEQDPKSEQYLHDLAARVGNRQTLKAYVEGALPILLDLEPEEILELKDLTILDEREPAFIPLSTEEEDTQDPLQMAVPPTEAERVLPPTPLVTIEEEEEPTLHIAEEDMSPPSSIATETGTELTQPEQSPTVKEEINQAAIATSKVDKDKNTLGESFSMFEAWRSQHQLKQANRFARLRHTSLRQMSDAAKVKKVARESVEEKKEVAAEPLAILLAKQGQYEKAIAMYEQLRLANPEKSRYFAAAIEKLKQKI